MQATNHSAVLHFLLSSLYNSSDRNNIPICRRCDLDPGAFRTGVDDLAVADIDSHMSSVINDITGLGLRV